MAKTRFTVDELYEQLRTQGYSSLDGVKYAILETSGQVSVLPYTRTAPLTPQSAGIEVQEDVTLPVLVVNDGHILTDNLRTCGRDLSWLQGQLKKRRLTSPKQVFLMTVDEAGAVVCVTKEGPA